MTEASIFFKTAPNSTAVYSKLRRAVLCLGALALAAAFGCGELPDDLGGKNSPDVTFVGPLPRWMSWSKQSDAIAFEQTGRLVVARGEDLKDARAITGYSEYSHPSWSPDGRWIVHDHPIDDFRGDDIWARSATQDALPVRFTKSPLRDYMPKWSADGNWIAFHSRRSPTGHVWMISADVEAEERVPTAVAPALSREDSLAWSPTGARLAFVAFVNDSIDIWVVDAPDGEASLLGGTAASDNQPRWTPDGTAVGFISGSGAGANVWIQEDRPDSVPRKLTEAGGVTRFYWLMDGKALAYLNEENALYALPLEEGAAPVHLRDTVDFAASPDGRRYVYVERVGNVYRHFADRFPPPFQP